MMESFILELLSNTVTVSDSSSSDDECFEICKRKRQKIMRTKNYVPHVLQSYSEETFKEHFCMNRELAYKLIDRLSASRFMPTYKGGRNNIEPEKAFLITLWYLSNNETFRQISDRFDVSLSSAHRSLCRVVNFILTFRHEYIKWPSREEAQNISYGFKQYQGINDVIGVIDGCHIRISKPQRYEDSYVNRKGFYSILVQGVVDHKKLFLDVYCGERGSLHDARLLRKSNLYRKASKPQYLYNKFLIGDSAYPALEWLVPPFKDNGSLTENHKIFNSKLSSTHIVVKHAYALLKGRFRRLQYFENLDINLIVKCVMCACVLHNICILENDNTCIAIPDITQDFNNRICRRNGLHGQTCRRNQIFSSMFGV